MLRRSALRSDCTAVPPPGPGRITRYALRSDKCGKHEDEARQRAPTSALRASSPPALRRLRRRNRYACSAVIEVQRCSRTLPAALGGVHRFFAWRALTRRVRQPQVGGRRATAVASHAPVGELARNTAATGVPRSVERRVHTRSQSIAWKLAAGKRRIADLHAFARSGIWPRPRALRVRSPALRAGCPVVLDFAARRLTHCANCVRCVETDATRLRTKRAAHAAAKSALLGVA
jgi:hypothetical protein